ncbi:MAG: GTPase [Bacteroidota bacterium]
MKQLIFVYNAKSNFLDKGIDFFHKAISPNTYSCNLCKLTYGTFSEKAKWKEFRQSEQIDMKFIFKDQFENEHNKKYDYPVILLAPTLEVVMGKQEINKLSSIDDLILAIKRI